MHERYYYRAGGWSRKNGPCPAYAGNVTDDATPTRTGDGSYTLHSSRYGQTFHSHHGAVAEAKHVFLEGSGLLERFAAGRPSLLLEVGFGTGLNCWLSADAAESARTELEIITLERDPLPAETVRLLEYGQHLQHPEILEAWLACRESLPRSVPAGRYSCTLSEHSHLTVLVGDATTQELPDGRADVIFHDAFSPEANAELWTAQFLTALHEALKPGGTLVTYSVKGEVRRRLQAIGFTVTKRPGPPGGKREMLTADKNDS